MGLKHSLKSVSLALADVSQIYIDCVIAGEIVTGLELPHVPAYGLD